MGQKASLNNIYTLATLLIEEIDKVEPQSPLKASAEVLVGEIETLDSGVCGMINPSSLQWYLKKKQSRILKILE